MNMYQVIIKISIISLTLLNNVLVLSMEKPESSISTEIIKQKNTVKFIKHTSLTARKKHVDPIMLTPNWSNVEMEKTLRLRYDIKGIGKNNIKFIEHRSLTDHKKDVNSILLAAAWFNDLEGEKALRLRYDIQSIRFDKTYKPESFFVIDLNYVKELRDKYNNNNLDQSLSNHEFLYELEPALYCAVACNDLEAIGTISSKIQQYHPCIYSKSIRNQMNTCLLMSIIQRDHIVTFEAVVKADPFLVGSDNKFIKALNNADYISQDLKNKYSWAYKQCKFALFNYSKGPYSYF